MSYPKRSVAERLALYSTPGENGCVVWTKARSTSGYGRLLVIENGKKVDKFAHRLAYELAIGPIAAGLFVCHRCDNPACINPDHLFLGTAADNNADMMRKGRYRPGGKPNFGSKNGRAKLTEGQVQGIRKLVGAYGIPAAAIARSLGMSASAVQRAANNFRWRSVSI